MYSERSRDRGQVRLWATGGCELAGSDGVAGSHCEPGEGGHYDREDTLREPKFLKKSRNYKEAKA